MDLLSKALQIGDGGVLGDGSSAQFIYAFTLPSVD